MKPIVIAGSGISLKSIDYTRLPLDFDVFRCNMFFLEQKYYLGKKITGYFSHIDGFPNLLWILMMLEQKKEYFTQNHYFVSQNYTRDSLIKSKFPFLELAWDVFMQDKKISQFISLYFNMLHKWPTTGIIMLFTAIALGYRELYVVGIDFYQTEQMYAFEFNAESKNKYHNSQKKNLEESYWHTLDVEKKSLELIQSMEHIKLYSLSKESPISELIPMAPVQNNNPYHPEQKSPDCTSDEMLIQMFSDPQLQKNITNLRNQIKKYE